MNNIQDPDPYIGLVINNDWTLTERIGSGKIGIVYKAERNNPYDVLACKIIKGEPDDGWDTELIKVIKLKGVPSVIQYHSHAIITDENNNKFVWILWNDFVNGINLKTYLEKTPWPLDMAFIESIADVILNVLYACDAVDIVHGDLHPGNILISEPDNKTIHKKRKIWVSDFGYGGSHNAKVPKDDFKHLSSIIITLLDKLSVARLNKRDRIMHEKLHFFFAKRFLENDPTQGKTVRNLESLILEFRDLSIIAKQEAERNDRSVIKEPGDYLWAEAIGNKAEEWKNLFVPEFLAVRDLLNKNITVLTGARGCGKTMAFKRLTAYMDKIIGEPSGVPGSESFEGFYLNCRNLIEAFPWIPDNLSKHASAQIIHYFHLAWLTEICNTLYQCFYKIFPFEWLQAFVFKYFKSTYFSLPDGADCLIHIMAFLEDQKELCRLTEFGKVKDIDWPLYKMDFLDELMQLVAANTPWSKVSFYFFLDDYTIPIIPRNVQQILNPIIFKRRDSLFFKISTESFISFERTAVRGKPLELHQDFELIDLANESLHQLPREKKALLEKIFKPRIDRHIFLKNHDLSLEHVLGHMNMNSNELAWTIRNGSNQKGKKRIVYCGIEAFAGMWSSDIRIMIQMLVDMFRMAHFQLEKGKTVIDAKIQNDIYRTTGGELLVFTESVPSPSTLEKNITTKRNTTFGTHLKRIVEAFINISKYEMAFGKLVSNQSQTNPKQAFRLEIIDKFELGSDVRDYYEGLIRWHIFLQDWRGRSVRGMITPRLFLNRILIPNSQLTFSSHDNIHLSNQEFNRLLKDPGGFLKYWVNKRNNDKKNNYNKNQGALDF